MYRLLPQEQIDNLHRQYLLRLVTVFLWFVAIVIVIGAVSLFPSYLLLNTQTKDVETQLVEQASVLKQDDAGDIAKKLNQTAKLLGNFNVTSNKFQPSALIQLIVKYKIPGISIDTFEISNNQDAGALVTINGRAGNRDVLDIFKKSLEKDSKVTSVFLPISSLAKSTNISFVMRITTK